MKRESMIKICEETTLNAKIADLRAAFAKSRKDTNFLNDIYSAIWRDADAWKYSTGPIFDRPPYGDEMAGFNPGRLLKKDYPGPMDARLKGVYSSGFKAEKHIVTVHPSKPQTMPLRGSYYIHEDEITKKYSFEIFDESFTNIARISALTGLGHIFFWKEDILAHVGVGTANAWAIWLYYYDKKNVITGASMVTGPEATQSDFEFFYNDDGSLVKVRSNGVIWEQKTK